MVSRISYLKTDADPVKTAAAGLVVDIVIVADPMVETEANVLGSGRTGFEGVEDGIALNEWVG
jgi:hypothetical protein